MKTQFKRAATGYLMTWKMLENRKPLIVRGARQVGKTTLVEAFGRTYDRFIHLNLERPSDAELFSTGRDARTVVEIISLRENVSREELSNTLLFIDEIQERP